jgi:hypothetical protein
MFQGRYLAVGPDARAVPLYDVSTWPWPLSPVHGRGAGRVIRTKLCLSMSERCGARG